MLAVIGDIHANLEALTAVVKDMEMYGADEIICVGDVIGFGPDPRACLEFVMTSCSVTILGNHDEAAFIDPEGFNEVAMQAVRWTREQLQEGPAEVVPKRMSYLSSLPRSHEAGGFLYVHGSPREPTNEYVFPEDIYNPRKMDQLFSRFAKYCVKGHTHLPGVFFAAEGKWGTEYQFVSASECGYRYRLDGEKTMIDVGSVGQPRDRDPRACYVLLNGNEVIFRRVDYDVDTTRGKLSSCR